MTLHNNKEMDEAFLQDAIHQIRDLNIIIKAEMEKRNKSAVDVMSCVWNHEMDLEQLERVTRVLKQHPDEWTKINALLVIKKIQPEIAKMIKSIFGKN